jgi:hypothetical protein
VLGVTVKYLTGSKQQQITKQLGVQHFQFSPCKEFYFKRSKAGTNVLIQGTIREVLQEVLEA